jgi:hypothetical protein
MKFNLLFFYLFAFFFFASNSGTAQHTAFEKSSVDMHSLVKNAGMLSSASMQGREVGTEGGYRAADSIAVWMVNNGLLPFGKNTESTNPYFHPFEVRRFQVKKASVQIADGNDKSLNFRFGVDFGLKACPKPMKVSSEAIFAGYGIDDKTLQYSDYIDLDVKGKIVVVLNGFPGHNDSSSLAWKKFGKNYSEKGDSFKAKRKAALDHGAIAMIFLDVEYDLFKEHNLQQSFFNATGEDASAYPDFEYLLPGDTAESCIPVIIPGLASGRIFLEAFGLNSKLFEEETAESGQPEKVFYRKLQIQISTALNTETITARNILGMVKGEDTTRCIIVGAHYDHLGIRGDSIYFGADDNASGTAAVIELSSLIAGSKPKQNIVFACWDAEEKGLLGSRAFVQQTASAQEKILLYINMDMISRSDVSDTLKQQLSIGIRQTDTLLVSMAAKINKNQTEAFNLDIWDVTGHSGSDYAAFIAKDIPVMSFFSGFHSDYHSPRDVVAGMDFNKMTKIVGFIYDCLLMSQEKLNPISQKN